MWFVLFFSFFLASFYFCGNLGYVYGNIKALTFSIEESLMSKNDTLTFADEIAVPLNRKGYWSMLIVDDDPDVHKATTLALKDFMFEGKSLSFHSAYNSQETYDILETLPELSVVLLDIVMEEEDSGLRLISKIRHKFPFANIIVRTGQPGLVPVENIAHKYEIYDYKEKDELTSHKLNTCIASAIRASCTLVELNKLRSNLQKMVAQKTIELSTSLHIQKVLSEILKNSLTEMSLEEQLEKVLDSILELTIHSFTRMKGAIFLTDRKNKDTLLLKAQKGFVAEQKRQCQQVAFGHCICGKAAVTKEVVYKAHLDEEHSITYSGMQPHGHYCVPIKAGDDVLGIIAVYLEENCPEFEGDVRFLELVASNLAHAITQRYYKDDLRKSRELLWGQANNDELTGLPNRRLFNDRLVRSISFAKRKETQMALVFLDLDRFKHVNDSLGHEAGDILLKEVANRLQHCVRETDTVAKLSGDEFTLILDDITDIRSVENIARKVIQSIGKPFEIYDSEAFVTASLGISFFPTNSEDVETLIKQADSAMYQAKQLGKNTYKIYSNEIDDESTRRVLIESELHKAIQRKEFHLEYQPILAASTNKVVGVEALLRWTNKKLGRVSPAEFIQIAEKTGMMPVIGDWIIYTACKQAKDWVNLGKKKKIEVPYVSINLSVVQAMREEFLPVFTTVLQKTKVPPKYIHLEVTETSAMTDVDKFTELMVELNDLGVKVVIDDFGTGYSSLSYLKKLHAFALKIDKSFVTDLPVDKEDISIVKAIIAMAHSLKLKVIAEGVETEDQFKFLKSLSCDRVQGFLKGKPMSPTKITKMLKK